MLLHSGRRTGPQHELDSKEKKKEKEFKNECVKRKLQRNILSTHPPNEHMHAQSHICMTYEHMHAHRHICMTFIRMVSVHLLYIYNVEYTYVDTRLLAMAKCYFQAETAVRQIAGCSIRHS